MMIEFIKLKEKNVSEALRFLDQHSICIDKNQFHHMFIVKDQGEVFGFGILELTKDAVLIKNVYIDMKKRMKSYGDSLVRTMLHYAYLKNISWAYYKIQNSSLDSFFRKMGFREEDPSQNDNLLFLNLEQFFSTNCYNCHE